MAEIGRDCIESAYCFIHQKLRVYEFSNNPTQRDENVGGYIIGDETGVVAHVDDDGFLGVGVGLETDKCLLACRGLQIRGAAFLLVFSFLFPESFYGILQKIRYHVREEALIGINQQILGRNRNLYFVVAEHRHSFQKWLHIEEGRLRLGNMGETAIVIDESQQLFRLSSVLQVSLA